MHNYFVQDFAEIKKSIATFQIFSYLLNQKLNIKTYYLYKFAPQKCENVQVSFFQDCNYFKNGRHSLILNVYSCMSNLPPECTHLYALRIKNILP